MISRRRAIKTIGVAAAAVPMLRIDAAAQAAILDEKTLAAIGDVVLPSECDRQAAAAAFARWIRNYHEGADMDHGYGFTRVRATGPSPAKNYPAQVAALDADAHAAGAANFASATVPVRRTIIEKALADAKVDRLPQRPTGAHVAADLMAHYFHSSDAEDLCYEATIGRDSCRGLPGSENRPAPLRSIQHPAPTTKHRAPTYGHD